MTYRARCVGKRTTLDKWRRNRKAIRFEMLWRELEPILAALDIKGMGFIPLEEALEMAKEQGLL